MSRDATLIGVFSTEAGEEAPSWHVPVPASNGPGRRSAFGYGVTLHRRSLRLPPDVWASLDALAKEWGTSDDGAVARLLRERVIPEVR